MVIKFLKVNSIVSMAICFLLLMPLVSSADVRLNALFSDHMVVQRETRIPVWGWADPYEKISIWTSWGDEAETVAALDSTWRLKLKTPKAGGPFQITITGKIFF
jgi:sialate O-acetylesterase